MPVCCKGKAFSIRMYKQRAFDLSDALFRSGNSTYGSVC